MECCWPLRWIASGGGRVWEAFQPKWYAFHNGSRDCAVWVGLAFPQNWDHWRSEVSGWDSHRAPFGPESGWIVLIHTPTQQCLETGGNVSERADPGGPRDVFQQEGVACLHFSAFLGRPMPGCCREESGRWSNLRFRRSNVVFVLVLEHWTTSLLLQRC